MRAAGRPLRPPDSLPCSAIAARSAAGTVLVASGHDADKSAILAGRPANARGRGPMVSSHEKSSQERLRRSLKTQQHAHLRSEWIVVCVQVRPVAGRPRRSRSVCARPRRSPVRRRFDRAPVADKESSREVPRHGGTTCTVPIDHDRLSVVRPSGHFTESLILAQDERWRRA